MTRLLVVTVFLCLACQVHCEAVRTRYDHYRVYQLKPQTSAQLAVLQTLDGARDSFIFVDGVHYANTNISVLVAPNSVSAFLLTLRQAGVAYELLDSNAQKQLDIPEQIADPNRRTSDYRWTEYHELNDTYTWLHSLAAKYSTQVSVFVAGQSYEGREILGVKISYGGSEKRAVFLEGGMHAREWIGPATTTYIINQLLTSDHADVRLIAEAFDWYIVPHANPDGYVYTHTHNRLWRKTRTPYANDCYGADPNRNWDFHWNEVGASSNPCSDTYAGPAAFSEIETRTFADYIRSLKGKIFLYVSFHSYSQLLLFPYGHTKELPPNYKNLKRVFDVSVNAIRQRYGTKYTGGNIYDAIYPASGASVDWAYGLADVPYSFCYELRPSGSNLWTGFKLPAAQIIPTGEETLDALVAMVKEANNLGF